MGYIEVRNEIFIVFYICEESFNESTVLPCVENGPLIMYENILFES